MRLDELERIMWSKLDDLIMACKGICGSNAAIEFHEFKLNDVVEDCAYCILKNLIDTLDINSLDITLSNGSSLEFIKLDDVIIELGSESASIYPIDEFIDRINELKEFNILSDEDIVIIMKWLNV